MTRKTVPVLQLAFSLVAFAASAAPGDENWDNRFTLPPGLDGPVNSMTTVGKSLYVAGDFKHAGSLEVNGLACWDGQRWTGLLNDSDFSGQLYTTASDGKNLFIGGWFTISSIAATNIAKWNGSSWERLDNGVNQQCGGRVGVNAIVAKGSLLYVGGSFSVAGSVGATNIAVWDGRKWSALGAGIGGTCNDQPYGIVNALAVQGNSLYAGGIFHNSGSVFATNLAVWDGRSWSSVGGGVMGGSSFSIIQNGIEVAYSGTVSALQGSPRGLYVGGNFAQAGDIPAANIALWNGKAWTRLSGLTSDSPGAQVRVIAAAQQGVVVGGWFDRADGIEARNIARLNGVTWSAIGAGFSGPVYAVASTDALYAGGEFGLSGQTQAPFIARLSGDQWSPLQPGNGNAAIGYIAGLAAAHGKAYLVGQVTSVGALPTRNVAAWDGGNWNSLGGGIPAFAYEGVVARSNLYVHGDFRLPGIGATNVACFNGQGWSGLPNLNQLPSDAVARISAMAGDDSHLYLGLYPELVAPGTPLPSDVLFVWNSSLWTDLGAVLFSGGGAQPEIQPGYLSGMTASEGHLYIFGVFNRIGPLLSPGRQVTVTNIAHWDGRNWLPMGGALTELGFGSAYVQIATAIGNRLYVLAFDSSQPDRTCLALWDGAVWRCLLEGAYLPINSLAATRRALYAGGYFNQIGGSAANYIARFDGANWSPLGSGLDGPPNYRAMAADENSVCVSGLFTTAGGNSSYHFGIWREP